jgi:hypothetical protein
LKTTPWASARNCVWQAMASSIADEKMLLEAFFDY